MIRLIKVCFWIAIVVFFLPEDDVKATNGNNINASSAIKLANTGIEDVSGFCTRNPEACLQGKEALASLSQKTIRTARSIYEYIQDTSAQDAKYGLEPIFNNADMLSIEQQISAAQSRGQTLSVADLNIDFNSQNTQ
ncbi:MAG: DUF5330 domain-containing protein [Rhizobiales bacterium]|nr:DUF5330 domain-containing protein [Hyphomicrobiales bacterium]NRB13407.1 DUF5330 domain-containing protein [Hyphomicrobiales bacterium]